MREDKEKMKKLAIITSHPIQYNAPLFRLIAQRKKIELKVFYTWGQAAAGNVYDPDFKKSFTWDIPLLEGYDYELLENISIKQGGDHFRGIINRNLIERINVYEPDALLIYGWSFQSHLQVMRHYKGKVPVLFRGDSTLLDEQEGRSFKKLMRRLFLKWVYQYIDKALYTGAANKAYFLKHGVAKEQLVYAPHAVDNDRFEDRDGCYTLKAKQWRTDLGIPSDAFVFLFAGKLEPKKNPLLLLSAFEQLNKEDTYLLFVGNGILEKELKEKEKQNKRVLFLDFQNQQVMPVVYRLGDVFVLPSQGPGETWGLSVNEAMACGRAILVSNKCGCSANLIKTNGYVFESGHLKELVSKMLDLTSDKYLVSRMGKESSELIRNFHYQQTASAVEESL
jgi:glycosyltransferase involved in cell wall biosynthesis